MTNHTKNTNHRLTSDPNIALSVAQATHCDPKNHVNDNATSSPFRNLRAAVALYFAWYNFCRVHGSLRVTPAMAAGITDTIWDLERLLP